MIKNDIKFLALGVAALGVVALPMASYADTSTEASQTIVATITSNNSISISPTETSSINLGVGEEVTSDPSTITVQWNGAHGYNIKYTGQPLTGVTDNSKTIAASSSLVGDNEDQLSGDTWGIVYQGNLMKANTGNLFGSSYETTKGSKSFQVSYRIKASNNIVAQDYRGTILYELTAETSGEL